MHPRLINCLWKAPLIEPALNHFCKTIRTLEEEKSPGSEQALETIKKLLLTSDKISDPNTHGFVFPTLTTGIALFQSNDSESDDEYKVQSYHE